MRLFTKVSAFFSSLMFGLFSLQAHAITCTNADPNTSACALAQSVDFADVQQAIIVIVTALIALALLAFAARTVFNWVRGKRGV